jgi:hypothetical protein
MYFLLNFFLPKETGTLTSIFYTIGSYTTQKKIKGINQTSGTEFNPLVTQS